MNQKTASGDVIANQEDVQENQLETGDDVIVEGQEDLGTPQVEKPKDDYWKNKAYELERKAGLYEKTAQELAEIKEMIKSQQNSPSQKEQYSEEQLRAALSSDTLTPEQERFARSELSKLEQRKLEEREERIIERVRKEQQDQLTRQQAEQQVINDPRFQDAFVKLPNGTVQWNQESPLAQMMGGYMNDSALKGRADAILIAAKLAYTDVQNNVQQKDLTKLKRQNEQLKSQTMVEGGGKNFNKPVVDPYRESLTTLQQRPSDRKAGVAAVREFLRKRDATNK